MFNTYVPIQNSFEFAKEIADQDPGLFMASLDVESLYMCWVLYEEHVCVENVCVEFCMRNMYVVRFVWRTCMWYIYYEG